MGWLFSRVHRRDWPHQGNSPKEVKVGELLSLLTKRGTFCVWNFHTFRLYSKVQMNMSGTVVWIHLIFISNLPHMPLPLQICFQWGRGFMTQIWALLLFLLEPPSSDSLPHLSVRLLFSGQTWLLSSHSSRYRARCVNICSATQVCEIKLPQSSQIVKHYIVFLLCFQGDRVSHPETPWGGKGETVSTRSHPDTTR